MRASIRSSQARPRVNSPEEAPSSAEIVTAHLQTRCTRSGWLRSAARVGGGSHIVQFRSTTMRHLSYKTSTLSTGWAAGVRASSQPSDRPTGPQESDAVHQFIREGCALRAREGAEENAQAERLADLGAYTTEPRTPA